MLDQQQCREIEQRVTQINDEVYRIRDGLHTFSRIHVQPGYESQTRSQEHADLSRKHQALANKFREQVERFSKSVQLQQDKQKVRSQRMAAAVEDEESKLVIAQAQAHAINGEQQRLKQSQIASRQK